MKKVLLLFYFFPLTCFANSSFKTDSLLNILKSEINKSGIYIHKKEILIKKLKKHEPELKENDYQARFILANWLYDEYKSYQFDSAYVYVNKMIRLSALMHGKPREYYSNIKLSFILLSSGMFKETIGALDKVDISQVKDSVKSEYYFLKGRYYYDLAKYNNDKYFSPAYEQAGNRYLDSAIFYSYDNNINRVYYTGLQKIEEQDFDAGSRNLESLLRKGMPLSMHLKAMSSCSLGNIYINNNKQEEGLNLMTEAAIADIRSSTRETVALYTLAELLYKKGDIKDAYDFIKLAKADADFYGARQRKIQIAAILPLIAAARLNDSEHQKNEFLVVLVIITSLGLLVVCFLVMIFKQLKKLKFKERVIEDKNLQLNFINEKLLEDTKIKEEYIGQFFKVISGYIVKLEKLKMSVETKLAIKKYDDIQPVIESINIKKERADLYYNFDHIFVKIFPNFIESFNALFEEKNQSWPHEEEVLNTDIRIFALIRMGINDNETIAKILEYSINTIYVYKMRIKAKSLFPEDFEDHIMAIKAIDFD